MSWCPGRHTVAVLVNPAKRRNTSRHCETSKRQRRAMGLQIRVLNASTSREIDAAFASFVRERPDALFVVCGSFFTSRRVQLPLGDAPCGPHDLSQSASLPRPAG